MAEILASKLITTGISIASSPAVKAAMSTGTGLYYTRQGYKAFKNRKKRAEEQRKREDRDRFIENLMRRKTYYDQCNNLKKKLDILEELHNKFIGKKMLKSWKNYNIMSSKAAILIQKRWRGVLGRYIASRKLSQLHGIDVNLINYFDSDNDS